MRMAARRTLALAFLVGTFLAPARLAWAHGQMQEPTTQPSGAAMPVGDHPAHLKVVLPDRVRLGATVTIRASLTDADGHPISGATIYFERPAYWGDEVNGHMLIGSAVTDRMGMATITEQLREAGGSDVDALFAGNSTYRETEASASYTVTGDRQLFRSHAGIRIRWLNLWVLGGVIALVWVLYFVVGLRILEILRGEPAAALEVHGTTSRRQFLARALPYGAQAGIGLIGGSLLAIVARSPRTHGNLMSPPDTMNYQRSPVARIGKPMPMREMPMPLDRTVSFSGEVLPIFQRHGGPHVVAPRNSPPPGNLRLDTYEGVMAKEGVVVPGKPEESELIAHLLAVGMQMPPSVPPLPDAQVQLIATWIAQGARDN